MTGINLPHCDTAQRPLGIRRGTEVVGGEEIGIGTREVGESLGEITGSGEERGEIMEMSRR